jgi:porin
MGGIRVNLVRALMLGAAVLAWLPRAATAQATAPVTVAAAERMAAQDAPARSTRAARTRTVAAADKPPTVSEAAVKRSRLIGKVHERHGRLHEHLARVIGRNQRNPDWSDPYVPYANFIAELKKDHGLSILWQPTIMTQWGSPNGGPASTQVILSPSIKWELPRTDAGQGTITFSYTSNRYYAGGQSGTSLQSRLNLLNPVNDTPANSRMFNQFTYEEDFTGGVLALGVGQFPLSNYDQNTYAASQQMNFIGFALAQNASQTYPTAGLGAYAQITPIPNGPLDFVVGLQDANNIPANDIWLITAESGPYTSFAYVRWTPTIANLGASTYSLLYYHQPSVPLQPAVSDGWSFNASQDLDKNWGLFLRANAATGPSSPIKDSIAGGFVYNDVFGRGTSYDQLGVGIARNATNTDAFVDQNVRASEWVVEAYVNRKISDAWILGPDVQVYIKPALNPGQSSAQVYTLRLTGLF